MSVKGDQPCGGKLFGVSSGEHEIRQFQTEPRQGVDQPFRIARSFVPLDGETAVIEEWRPKVSLTKGDEIYVQLREDILWGVLPPNQILSESDFVLRYNASRSPIRYALARALEADLISVKARQGYLINALGISDAQEIVFLRSVLESAAAERASQLMSADDISRLRKLAGQDFSTNGVVDGRKLAVTNRAFHLLIAESTGNSRLVKNVSRLLDDMLRVLAQVSDERQEVEMRERHLRIVDAIESKDPAKARRAMFEELEASSRRIADSVSLFTPG
jgi:DNA-binding GntR family transcriptional regulator